MSRQCDIYETLDYIGNRQIRNSYSADYFSRKNVTEGKEEKVKMGCLFYNICKRDSCPTPLFTKLEGVNKTRLTRFLSLVMVRFIDLLGGLISTMETVNFSIPDNKQAAEIFSKNSQKIVVFIRCCVACSSAE